MTQNTDPAAVAAEYRKKAAFQRELESEAEESAARVLASMPDAIVHDLYDAAADSAGRALEADHFASVLEAAAARIRELEAERDELFGLFDRDQAAAPVQPRPPGWKASGLWEFAMLERRKRIKATKALREASELLANPGVWTPPVADALAIINTALRALAEEGRDV